MPYYDTLPRPQIKDFEFVSPRWGSPDYLTSSDLDHALRGEPSNFVDLDHIAWPLFCRVADGYRDFDETLDTELADYEPYFISGHYAEARPNGHGKFTATPVAPWEESTPIFDSVYLNTDAGVSVETIIFLNILRFS